MGNLDWSDERTWFKLWLVFTLSFIVAFAIFGFMALLFYYGVNYLEKIGLLLYSILK